MMSELSQELAEQKALTEHATSIFIEHGINAEEELDLINELENLTMDKVN